jgi:hypothetical protein
MNYTCDYCGYTGRDTEFFDGWCPACCADNFTGEVDPKRIPLKFFLKKETKRYRILFEGRSIGATGKFFFIIDYFEGENEEQAIRAISEKYEYNHITEVKEVIEP